MHFGLALPTGAESVAEYLDLDLAAEADVDLDDLAALLSPALPAGVDVTALAAVDPRAPSLQEDVDSCTWRVAFAPGVELAAVVDRALASSSLLVERERKGRLSVDDVRPAILTMSAGATVEGEPELEAVVATRPRALRPQELLQALDPALEATRVCRTHQWIERDGLREEPLAVAPHAVGARAQ
jgi:radical SAM-linked protein